ncbi:transcriptional activator protein Pur-beta-B-like isoform X2 [Actinia tenebrosa]|uniref:Transcriptional activator protein Pur-beta-B-like isoform X2 n=1 Tax=Actinia tenebrosa TaxID=6105 RepID=A0A6P8J1Y6_ACTTE|nr:transcriptional activator protein Pur-beta-B-like isoform X2 [Actinia tenebrosa]
MAATGDGASGGEYTEERPANVEGDEELMSKSLQIQSKRFYIDLKSNRRGKYIKISELPTNRSTKRKIILSLACGREFRDKLTIFAEFLAQQDTGKSEETVPEDGRLKSEMITGENKRYYLDLKENNRGRFLKVSQAPIIFPRGDRDSRGRGPMRKEIAIPAQGIVDIRNSLSEILEECGSDDDEGLELPKPCELRVEQKRFYFDVGSNARGVFLRISEVTANYRTSITIPKVGWARVRDTIGDLLDKVEGED